MTRNNIGNFDGLRIRFNDASIASQFDEVMLVCNNVALHDIFAQLTAQDIVSLIPDQSTLSEVHDELLKVSVYKL